MPDTKLDLSAVKGMRPPDQAERKYRGKRWAVIVGISEYEHKELNLDYADQDADELYNFLIKPRGGGFQENRIKRLTNKKATFMEVNKALKSFLKQPEPDDLVLIYFSCHGAPDPATGIVYLLTYDTDPMDISGTAQPMEVIQDVLQQTLKAKHVVVLIDACHGAAVGSHFGGPKGGANDAEIINLHLLEMGKTREGIAMLTSSEANELSHEGKQWGGGHGVFTHCLLEGLKGGADDGDTGIVRVGKLFDYVRKRVIEETGEQQRPVIGSESYDPGLPLAIIGDISVVQHFQLGCCLHEMGRQLPDKRCFDSAVYHFDRAIALSHELFNQDHPQAMIQKGLALMAQKKYPVAIQCLHMAETDNGAIRAEALFHQCIAYVKSEQNIAALETADKFLEQCPNDPRHAWLQQFRQNRMRALLIGVGDEQDMAAIAADIDMVAELLHSQFKIEEENCKILLDQDATRTAIIRALDELAQNAESGDQVIIYYNGLAETKSPEIFLLPADYETDQPSTAIGVQEFDTTIREIPAGSKTVILDCPTSKQLLELAQQARDYRLYCAAQVGQRPQVRRLDGNMHGVFSYALVQALREVPYASLADLCQTVEQRIHNDVDASEQTPFLQGEETEPLFWQLYAKPYLTAYDLSFHRVFYDLTVDELRQQAACLTEQFLPELPGVIARGFVEKQAYNDAITTLAWLQQRRHLQAEEFLTLGLAHLGLQRYEEARVNLQSYIETTPERTSELSTLFESFARLQSPDIHVLLVGVSKYANRDIPWVRGVKNDIAGIKRVLIDQLEIPFDNIRELTDADATQAAIREEFLELADKARTNPALFYYAGNGSRTTDGLPTILSYDARMAPIPNDILLADLAQIAGHEQTNLVAIIDAGWIPGLEVPWRATWGGRFVACDPRPRPGTRALRPGRRYEEPPWEPTSQWLEQRTRMDESVTHLRIGCTTIYPASIQATVDPNFDSAGEAIVEAELPSPFNVNQQEIYGTMTWALLRILLDSRREELTYAVLRSALAQELKWLHPFVLAGRSEGRFLGDAVQEEEIRQALRKLSEHEPIHQAIDLLEQQINRSENRDSEGMLDLGIAYAALEKYRDSLDALERAEKLGLASAELQYWLGRVRYEMRGAYESQGILDAAIGNLRAAKEQDPDHAVAWYYLIQAVLASIERKQIQELDEAWTTYVALGAPLGQPQEIHGALEKLHSTVLSTNGRGHSASIAA